MPLKVDYSDEALKQLAKMDKGVANDIMRRIDEFAATRRPSPKPLTQSRKGLYRLRFGDCRAVVKLLDDVVYVMQIGNRDKVYKQ